jgi:hypothetical protein
MEKSVSSGKVSDSHERDLTVHGHERDMTVADSHVSFVTRPQILHISTPFFIGFEPIFFSRVAIIGKVASWWYVALPRVQHPLARKPMASS